MAKPPKIVKRSAKSKAPAPLPSKQEILDFINNSEKPVGKRELARAFHLRGDQRTELRGLLKELASEGSIDKGHRRKMAPKGALPDVLVIEVHEVDPDGDAFAKPVSTKQHGDLDENVRIFMKPHSNRNAPAPKIGDRALARLKRIGDKSYEAEIIRTLHPAKEKVLGLLEATKGGCILHPTDRRSKLDYFIAENDLNGAKAGQLALVQPMGGQRVYGAQQGKITEVIGSFTDAKAFSLISIHAHGIPMEFSDEVLKEADALPEPTLGKRTDLRDIPLVTIDGDDARDFDDAVFAEPDTNPDNPGGWHLLVAIADVSNYIKTDGPLDKSAQDRGNSVYFPDRVVPMLPEQLSNGLCSLRPHEDRACMAVHMYIDRHGKLIRHKFIRGLMRSAARLTYEQAQDAIEGRLDETTEPIMETVIKPLYAAYQALDEARQSRGTLELEIPERRIFVNDAGEVTKILPRDRLDSHKLIEEFMITANVAAAEALEAKNARAIMYRVHDEPSLEKMEALRESLEGMGHNMTKGGVITPRQFTGILKKVEGTEQAQMMSDIILRSQAQAVYAPENLGHFGLALRRYCHFTSPIRRYADLLVHRALIKAYKLGDDGLEAEQADEFEDLGEHISQTERRASVAERECKDRYVTAYLSEHVGAEFKGRVNGVTRFGLFITLDETGADGLIPIATLPNDYFIHDEVHHALVGRQTGMTYRLGEPVTISLREADAITGSMTFAIVDGGKVDKKLQRSVGGKSGSSGRGGKKRFSRNKDQSSFKKDRSERSEKAKSPFAKKSKKTRGKRR
ncbi:ribonuclease R [Curvivirga aplysinae]|uniref:ribonuclease R n=1 Tax=Curvivirga aplysinae TaxID=2529852 RepID=UPI0012BC5265|nr:ribonuclease R [Curvivirga aplysinae]